MTLRLSLPKWAASYATRFMPFADAASPELPLGRLLRLAMFQLVIGMITALLVGTLNRVMIVELHVPTWWVALAVAIPMVFAPLRTLIGYRSDTHPSALGLRRIPYLWSGSLLLFGGLAIMPFALLLLSDTENTNLWLGQVGACLAFVLVGAGIQVTQTAGMALAHDLANDDKRPRVVALLYSMLLVGMIASSAVFGLVLSDFSPQKLIQMIQSCAVMVAVMNPVGIEAAAKAGYHVQTTPLGGSHQQLIDQVTAFTRGRAAAGRPTPSRSVAGTPCQPLSAMARVSFWSTLRAIIGMRLMRANSNSGR